MKMKKSIQYTILAITIISCLSLGNSPQSKAVETENGSTLGASMGNAEYSSTPGIMHANVIPASMGPVIQRTSSPDIPLNPEEKDENGKYVVRIYEDCNDGVFLVETRGYDNGEIIDLSKMKINGKVAATWLCQYQDKSVYINEKDASIEVNGSMKLTAIFPRIRMNPITRKPRKTPAPIIDRQKPVFKNLINKRAYYKKKVIAYVKDNKAIKRVTINGKKVKLTKVKKGKYKNYWKFAITRQKKITKYKIVAIDPSGNQAKRIIYLKK